MSRVALVLLCFGCLWFLPPNLAHAAPVVDLESGIAYESPHADSADGNDDEGAGSTAFYTPGGEMAALVVAMQELIDNSEVPEEYRDRAFEQYVDIRLLHTARNRMDCSLLTDVAIQLANGESILLRPHKLVSADALFRLAADWAIEEDDTNTLDRLRAAAEQFGRKELTEYIDTRAALGSESRLVIPAIAVAVNSMTIDEYAELRDVLLRFRDARRLKDWASIEALQERIGRLSLSEEQRSHLDMLIGPSRAEDESVKEDQAAADVLNMLGADSRNDPDRGRRIAAGILQVIAEALAPPGGSPPGQWPPQHGQWPPQHGQWPPQQDPSPPQHDHWPPQHDQGGSAGGGGTTPGFGLIGEGPIRVRPQPVPRPQSRPGPRW